MRLYNNTGALLVALLGFALAVLVSAGGESTPEEVRPMMPGSYHAKNNNGNGSHDEELQLAANFAVQELRRQAVVEADDPLSYSFLEKILVGRSNEDALDDNIHALVLDAAVQVVAGLNYRMTIELVDEERKCLGAFKSIVYDRFGDMSVTHWGKEISCEDALAILKNQQQEDGEEEHGT